MQYQIGPLSLDTSLVEVPRARPRAITILLLLLLSAAALTLTVGVICLAVAPLTAIATESAKVLNLTP